MSDPFMEMLTEELRAEYVKRVDEIIRRDFLEGDMSSDGTKGFITSDEDAS